MSEIEKNRNFWDRALHQLSGAWQDISDVARIRVSSQVRPDLPDDDRDRMRERIRDCIAARGGEAVARARAAHVGQSYLSLDQTGRRRFLAVLASDFDMDLEEVAREAQAMLHAEDAEAKRALAASLRSATIAPRMQLFTQFNGLPDGLKFLVDMRADALEGRREEPLLTRVADDLQQLLAAWFDVGFLQLRSLTWDSPASLLEKLIAYEAVHRIANWSDLKNRLEPDRRLFAFFHPNMPEEPLIFVEVALVDSMADSVQRLLDEDAPLVKSETAEAAIFYSISNTQPGLAGVSLGDFLIKRVVEELRRELPNLKVFATLSPIPGFTRWLRRHLADADSLGHAPAGVAAEAAPAELLAALDRETLEAVRPWRHQLLVLAARYLLDEKRGDRPLDPVARFHLSNGARVERLNWMGDLSEKGLDESACLMVNYLYCLDDIAANYEAFATQGEIAASGDVRALARSGRD
ncbi:MAG: malonyl-CoA decarboxylase [Rhodospirillaceae bacterium]|nr:malonyl-CoA decarboxylase [Rhodospirillaceae bacterium]|tara:strand:+ start:11042 stop:12439 length:1398 start_codon:yes stop_codon:yes gene_type:complete